MAKGFVWIVGAGPGDVRLLTLKAKEALEQAEVVVYDRLLTPSILSLVRPEAELIYAGKTPGGAKVSQDVINALLIAKAREGKKVVRLKKRRPVHFRSGCGRGGSVGGSGHPF
jgi:uroporphyrinogen III methyltransferase/synthase